MSQRHEQWVRDGQIVRGFYAHANGRDQTHFTGKVLAYTDAPTVMVETPDGRHLHWRADLCEPIRPKTEPKPCGMCVPDAVDSGATDLCPDHRTQFEAWLVTEGRR